MAIERNIAAQFQTTIPNVQPGVTVVICGGTFPAEDVAAALWESYQEVVIATRRLELLRTIERRCAGHIRRQGRVRR